MDFLDLLLHPSKANQRYSPLTEGLTEGQANELRWIFNRVREGEHRSRIRGERGYAVSDPAICQAYARDTSSLPHAISSLIKPVPGAVVMPRNRSELYELVTFAQRNNVPLTPRGGGTQPFGGAVPAEGGVVVDMRAFDEVLSIDADAQEVRVQAGAHWLDLEQALAEEGLALPVEPVTAPYSTVGGALATGGGGFGSHQHGTVRDLVTEAVVLTPEGDLETFTGSDLDLVEGCHGTTGLILEVVLRARKASELVPAAAAFDTLERAQAFIEAIAGLPVHSVHVLSPEFVELKQEALGARQLPRKKFVVVTATEATGTAQAGEEGDALESLQAFAENLDGEWVSEDAAGWEWEHRFHHHCFKRFGPSLAQGHAVVHRSNLARAWQAGADAIEAPEWAIWAVAVSPDEFMITGQVLADERIPNYSLAVGNAWAFADAINGEGGRPVAAGLLDAGRAKAILGRDRVKRLKAWKREHDKQEIMNPGKVIPARVKGLPVVRLSTALGPGKATFKSMRGGFDHRRGSGPDTSNRALWASSGRRLSPRLADLADDLYKCSGTGHTNRAGQLHKGVTYTSEEPRAITRAYRLDSQLPRGIVQAAQAILEGAKPGPELAGHALSLPAVPTYERNSQNGVPILETIEGVREAAQRVAGLDDRVHPLVDACQAQGNVLGEDQEARGDWMPGGAPAGVDTSTLLVAGDLAAYERTDEAAAAFQVLSGAGFGFTTLGPKEVHTGSILYRLGAFNAAAQASGRFAQAAQDHLGGRLPGTLLCLSNEDADVMRRRLGDLTAESEAAGWAPSVITLPQALQALLDSGRLRFTGGDEAAGAASEEEDGAEDEEGAEAEAEDAGDDAEEEATDEPASEDEALAESEEATDDESDEGEAADAAPESLDVTILHSAFATDEDRSALVAVVEAIPGVQATVADTEGLLVPDVAFALTEPVTTKELVGRFKDRFDGPVLVGCTDLAYVLSQAKVDVLSLQEVVSERMEVTGGGQVHEVGAGEAEEEGFKEFDIPEGAHRVELVKQNAAIPVYPDQSILDAAEEHGFEDLPYDCRAGSCVTCAGRWEGASPDQSEGQVLSEEEQKQYCLTCISRPTGDVKIWTGEEP